MGAAAGGLGGYFSDYGVDDGFARDMGGRLPPGRSALFVLAANVTPEKVADALEGRGGELFYSSFSPEVEQRFRSELKGEPAMDAPNMPPLEGGGAPPGPVTTRNPTPTGSIS